MSGNKGELDVTSNIRNIEKLKCELLKSVSELYENMLSGDTTNRTEILADMLISVYMLSGRLGVSQKLLDAKAAKRVKLKLLEQDTRLYADYAAVLKHIDK